MRKFNTLQYTIFMIAALAVLVAVPSAHAADVAVPASDDAAAINQKIADAADGDVIMFATGTYDVNLEIVNKNNLRLTSADPANPATIRPTSTIDGTPDIFGEDIRRIAHLGHNVTSSADLAIDNLIFDMSGIAAADRTAGLLILDSEGTIKSSTFRGFEDPSVRPTYQNVMIYIATSDNTAYDKDNRAEFTISKTEISSHGRIGVYAVGFVHVTLEGSTLTPLGFGYGLQTARLASANATGNTFIGYNKFAVIDNSRSGAMQIIPENGAPLQNGGINVTNTITDNVVNGSNVALIVANGFCGPHSYQGDSANPIGINVISRGNTFSLGLFGVEMNICHPDGRHTYDFDSKGDTITGNTTGFIIKGNGTSNVADGTVDVSITNGKFTDLTFHIINALADYVLVATHNYYGDSQPSFAAVSKGNIHYNPYYSDPELKVLVDDETGTVQKSTADLDVSDVCSISLGTYIMDFADAKYGTTSSIIQNQIKNAGNQDLGSIKFTSTGWQKPDGSALFDAVSRVGTNVGDAISYTPITADPNGVNFDDTDFTGSNVLPASGSPDSAEVGFVLDLTGVATGPDVTITESVTYSATCS